MFHMIPRDFDDLFDMHEFEDKKMKCDIYEKDDKYFLEMDLPGIKKEDIRLECKNGNLTISAEHSSESNDDDKKYLRRERRYGKYTRSFYLGEVDEKNIDAEFKDGILNVIIPKTSEDDQNNLIEIK